MGFRGAGRVLGFGRAFSFGVCFGMAYFLLGNPESPSLGPAPPEFWLRGPGLGLGPTGRVPGRVVGPRLVGPRRVGPGLLLGPVRVGPGGVRGPTLRGAGCPGLSDISNPPFKVW